jgi:hypothetical protein
MAQVYSTDFGQMIRLP